MHRLLILFLVLPWWAYVPVAGGVVWMGEWAHSKAVEKETIYADAFAAGPPELVDLARFDRLSDKNAADEVNVRGWIDTDYNYELTESTNGIPTTVRHMFMLFGENEPDGAKMVRAALMLTKPQKEAFVDNIYSHSAGFNDFGLVFEFNGFARTSTTLANMAVDAIAEQGLTKGPDFIYIQPFWEGREAALARADVPESTRAKFWLVAFGVVLFGLVKRMLAKGGFFSKPSREPSPQAAKPDTARPTAPMGGAMPNNVAPDSPLGRLAAKRARGRPFDPFADPAPDVAARLTQAPQKAIRDPFGTANAQTTGAPGIDVAPVADPVRPRRPAAELSEAPHARAMRPPKSRPAKATDDTSKPLDMGFLVKLAVAMVLVGGLAYNAHLIQPLAPLAGPLLVLSWVLVMVNRARRKGAAAIGRLRDGANAALSARRDRDAGSDVPLSAGPVITSRRQRGVI